jgi:Domain of unknown function (DUF397)
MANVGTDWTEIRFTKSSYTTRDQGDCVEIGVAEGIIGIRDSKLGTASPVLQLSETAFTSFLFEAKAGTFDQPA